jgi:hypothetical protein
MVFYRHLVISWEWLRGMRKKFCIGDFFQQMRGCLHEDRETFGATVRLAFAGTISWVGCPLVARVKRIFGGTLKFF